MDCILLTFSRFYSIHYFSALTKEHREGGDRPLECSISECKNETDYKFCFPIGLSETSTIGIANLKINMSK